MGLTEIMKSKGVTSQMMADATGLKKQTIDSYRRKDREPSLSAGLKIADYLGIDPHELLDNE